MKLICIMALLSLLSSSCSPKGYSGINIVVPSAKDALPALYNSAINWDKDVYLVSISIPIGPPGYVPYAIAVSYESTNENNKELLVQQDLDGEIITIENTSGYNSRKKEIKDEDWILDSQEIANQVSSFTRIEEFFKNRKDPVCGHMILKYHFEYDSTSRNLFWRVYLYDCENITDSVFVDVDPNSGKELTQFR